MWVAKPIVAIGAAALRLQHVNRGAALGLNTHPHAANP